jgi:hypothetical protein
MIAPRDDDPRIQGLVSDYETLESPTERRAMLTSLDSADREAVLKAQRQPDRGLPIVGPIVKRVLPGRGGQLYKTGQSEAEKATGLSAKKTSLVGRSLQTFTDKTLDEQKKSDVRLDSGDIGPDAWRKARSDRSTEYQGALKLLGIEFPKAAQVQADQSLTTKYYDTVATVAGSTPDHRTRAQILAAGLFAISLDDSIPEDPDYQSFFRERDEYKSALSQKDQKLLEEHLAAKETPKEQEFNRDMETLRPWFNADETMQDSLGLSPFHREMWRAFRAEKDKARLLLWRKKPEIQAMERAVASFKLLERQKPEVGAAIQKWNFVDKPKSVGEVQPFLERISP